MNDTNRRNRRNKPSGVLVAVLLGICCLLSGGCSAPAEPEPQPESAPVKENVQEIKDIGDDAVLAIVLERVSGADTDNITSFEKEFEHGYYEYDVELVYDGREYEFEIDGSNGNILSLEIE